MKIVLNEQEIQEIVANHIATLGLNVENAEINTCEVEVILNPTTKPKSKKTNQVEKQDETLKDEKLVKPSQKERNVVIISSSDLPTDNNVYVDNETEKKEEKETKPKKPLFG